MLLAKNKNKNKKTRERRSRSMINSFALLGEPLWLNGSLGIIPKVTILAHNLGVIFIKMYSP